MEVRLKLLAAPDVCRQKSHCLRRHRLCYTRPSSSGLAAVFLAPKGLCLSLAARKPAIRMRSPISRTPIVPTSQEGNRKRTAFALRTGVGALKVLETFGLEALLANSYLLTEEETVCDELNGRIQEISASGDKSLPANPPLTLGPVHSSPRFDSQPLSELNLSVDASPVVSHPAAGALDTPTSR